MGSRAWQAPGVTAGGQSQGDVTQNGSCWCLPVSLPAGPLCLAGSEPAGVPAPGPVLAVPAGPGAHLHSPRAFFQHRGWEVKADTSKYVDSLFAAGRECKLSHLNKANAESSRWSQISLISADEKYSWHLHSQNIAFIFVAP